MRRYRRIIKSSSPEVALDIREKLGFWVQKMEHEIDNAKGLALEDTRNVREFTEHLEEDDEHF